MSASKNNDQKNAPKKKAKKVVSSGVAHVRATFNNTIVNITDPNGNTLVVSTAGANRFKGSRKATPYAAQITAEAAGKLAQDNFGMKTIMIQVNGAGGGRESALRALMSMGFVVTLIKDITPVPHNGCKPRKRRRI